MIDEINQTARRAHHDDRGPDRVPAPAQALHRQPARARLRRAELRRRAEGRAAPGPRRDPGRRDARPRDDLHGADRRRDRPPRVRHAAHAGHRADDRPHHRRLPAPPAGAGARAALGRAAGDRDPAADPDRRRLRARGRLRGAGAHPGGAQPDPRGQDPPDLLGAADRHRARDADDGRLAGDARARRQDHPEDGRIALLDPRGAAAPARRGLAGSWHEHLRLQGDGPRRREGARGGRGRLQAGGLRPAEGARADRPRDRRQARLARDQARPSSRACQRRATWRSSRASSRR